MSQELVVYGVCSQCGGDGLFNPGADPGNPGTVSCTWPGCTNAPTGRLVVGQLNLDPGLDDVMDRINDLEEKLNDIIELLQP